jgi:hypothetical protein
MRRLVLAVTKGIASATSCRQPGVRWPSVEEAITRPKTIDRFRVEMDPEASLPGHRLGFAL